jgi:hypothetical protein
LLVFFLVTAAVILYVALTDSSNAALARSFLRNLLRQMF